MQSDGLAGRDSLAQTPRWRNVDLKTLREEIIPRNRPAVLQGLVEHWPMFRAGAQSPETLLEYVKERDLNHPIRVMIGPPDIKGVYFYRDDMARLNFDYPPSVPLDFHEHFCVRRPGEPAGGYIRVRPRWRRISRRSARKTRSTSWASTSGTCRSSLSYGGSGHNQHTMTISTASTAWSPGASALRFFRPTSSPTYI